MYVDAGAIRQTTDSMYQTPSESDSSTLCTVDIDVGICLCGHLCKHQVAILIHSPDVLHYSSAETGVSEILWEQGFHNYN